MLILVLLVVLMGIYMEVTEAGMDTKWDLTSTALEACLLVLPTMYLSLNTPCCLVFCLALENDHI